MDWRGLVFGDETLPDPDYPVDHVPETERKGLVSLSTVLLGFVFFAGTLWAGADVGTARGFRGMLRAMGVGYGILALYVATLSAIAARSGLTTVLLSRYTFGRWGAKGADLLLGGTQVGWFGVTIPLVAVPTAAFFGIESDPWVSGLILLWGVLHLGTAYFGYQGMERLSLLAVPVLVVVSALSMAIAVKDVGGFSELLSTTGTGELSFGAAVTVVVGTFVSGGTQVPNWARFATTQRAGFWAGLLTFLLGNSFLFLAGAVGGAVYDVTPRGDLYQVLAVQGLAGLGLLALVLNIWTTNDNAAYAFGVAGSEAFEFDRKRPFILAGSAIGIGLALAGVTDLLLPWLEALGTYVPPLGGVIIADFLLCRRMKIHHMENVEFVTVRWVGVGAYVVGTVCAVLTTGTVVPGVTIPAVVPGITAANGMLGAILGHVAGHYTLERWKLLAKHEVDPDAEPL
jgi:cytosine permease